METIRMYLENMFARLPQSADVRRIKEDLAVNMEEKYNELKEQGKSENEAIGIVISEFGNIDELISELGLAEEKEEPSAEKSAVRILEREEADRYGENRKKHDLLVGIGVFLCIASPAALILASGIPGGDALYTMGLIALIVLVGIAVGLFTYAGMLVEKYKYLLSEEFKLSPGMEQTLRMQQETYIRTHTIATIIGVMLCIFSPLPLIAMSLASDAETGYSYRVTLLLLIVAAAVFLFIFFGGRKEYFDILLQEGEFARQEKQAQQKSQKTVGIVASIFWPTVVLVYLGWGFLTEDWSKSWIIWPICGVAFGIFAAVMRALKRNTVD